MITWRFKRANTRTFSGTKHAFSPTYFPDKSLCGRATLKSTVEKVTGYDILPGTPCKTCRRMVETQQDFQ